MNISVNTIFNRVRKIIGALMDAASLSVNALLTGLCAWATIVAWGMTKHFFVLSHCPWTTDRTVLLGYMTSPDRLADAPWLAAAWLALCLTAAAACLTIMGFNALLVRVRAAVG